MPKYSFYHFYFLMDRIYKEYQMPVQLFFVVKTKIVTKDSICRKILHRGEDLKNQLLLQQHPGPWFQNYTKTFPNAKFQLVTNNLYKTDKYSTFYLLIFYILLYCSYINIFMSIKIITCHNKTGFMISWYIDP